MLMASFVLIALGLVVRYAGAWGVPFFSYTSDNGSHCTNTLTGYVCDPLTLADVELFSDVQLPADAQVVSGTYTATHDYLLTASLRVPARSAAAAGQALTSEFGGCQRDHPAPISTAGLRGYCTLANDDAVTRSGEPPSRLWVIGTGIRADGVRVISMTIRSR
jgi:hypothetical protein